RTARSREEGRPEPEREEGGPPVAARGLAEEGDPYAGTPRILIRHDADAVAGEEGARHLARSIPHLDRLHPERAPRRFDAMIDERVAQALHDRLDRYASRGDRRGRHLPVAEVAGCEDDSLPLGKGLLEALPILGRDLYDAVDLFGVEGREPQHGDDLAPEMPVGFAESLLDPVVGRVREGEPEVRLHHVPPDPEWRPDEVTEHL